MQSFCCYSCLTFLIYFIVKNIGIFIPSIIFQTELGTWEEDPGGWDDNVLEDSEVSEETRNLLLDKRKTDKQRRAMEQIKKREELRLNRAEKKPHLGMKLN